MRKAAGSELFDRMEKFDLFDERLSKIEGLLKVLVSHTHLKEDYGTGDFANLTRRSDLTVRRWCRDGRIHASKKGSGSGTSKEWVISHEELTRYRREGLLPGTR